VTTSDNPSSGKVREVLGMTERDTADLGILITLNEPTRKMNREANAAGMIKTAMKQRKREILRFNLPPKKQKPQPGTKLYLDF